MVVERLVRQQRRADTHVVYALMEANQAYFAVCTMAQVLKVSASGYYDWLDRPMSSRAPANVQLLAKG
jgi:hypothetical protein